MRIRVEVGAKLCPITSAVSRAEVSALNQGHINEAVLSVVAIAKFV